MVGADLYMIVLIIYLEQLPFCCRGCAGCTAVLYLRLNKLISIQLGKVSIPTELLNDSITEECLDLVDLTLLQ